MTEHENSIVNQVHLTKDAVQHVMERLVKMEEQLGKLDAKSVPVSKMEERANKIEKKLDEMKDLVKSVIQFYVTMQVKDKLLAVAASEVPLTGRGGRKQTRR